MADAKPTANEWTTEHLKEHLESMMASRDKAVDTALIAAEKAVAAALAAAKEAVAKAETASEKRFESVNEFRKTLSDQTASFIPRSEVAIMQAATNEKVATLDIRFTSFEQRTKGHADGYGVFVGVIGILIGIAGAAAAIIAIFRP